MTIILILIIILLVYSLTRSPQNFEHLVMLRDHKLEYNPNRYNIARYIRNKTLPIIKYTSPKNRIINPDIPLNVYMMWHASILPPKMKENLDRAKRNNPEIKFVIYNNDDCRSFIRNNFDEKVLNAYDRLKPAAYKADLWRYCVLYKLGGIYLDIKFMPVNGFKFIDIVDKERFMLERDGTFWSKGTYGISNAMIVVKAGNEILLDCIENIVDNVNNDFYGFNDLYPTGPGLLGQVYFEHKKRYDNLDLFFTGFIDGKYTIQLNNSIILQSYPEYQKERTNGGQKTYGVLYKQRQIYEQ